MLGCICHGCLLTEEAAKRLQGASDFVCRVEGPRKLNARAGSPQGCTGRLGVWRRAARW